MDWQKKKLLKGVANATNATPLDPPLSSYRIVAQGKKVEVLFQRVVAIVSLPQIKNIIAAYN